MLGGRICESHYPLDYNGSAIQQLRWCESFRYHPVNRALAIGASACSPFIHIIHRATSPKLQVSTSAEFLSTRASPNEWMCIPARISFFLSDGSQLSHYAFCGIKVTLAGPTVQEEEVRKQLQQ